MNAPTDAESRAVLAPLRDALVAAGYVVGEVRWGGIVSLSVALPSARPVGMVRPDLVGMDRVKPWSGRVEFMPSPSVPGARYLVGPPRVDSFMRVIALAARHAGGEPVAR